MLLTSTGSDQHSDTDKEFLSELLGKDAVARRGFSKTVEEFKRWLIENALQRSGGNRTEAPKTLGIQRTYLMKLIRDFGISVPSARSRPRHVRGEAEPDGGQTSEPTLSSGDQPLAPVHGSESNTP